MKKTWIHWAGFLLVMITFLLLFLWVRPELAFQAQQLGFSTSETFLCEYAAYPGGLAEYVALWFFQFFYYPFWGALIYTALLALLTLLIRASLFNKVGKFSFVLQFIPLLFAALLLTGYWFHSYFIFAFLFICLFFVLFKIIIGSKLATLTQLILTFLIFVPAYYIIGGFPFLILTGSSIILLMFEESKGRYYKIFFLLALYLSLPLIIARWFAFISYHDAFLKLVPFFHKTQPGFLLYAFLFSLPLVLLLSKACSYTGKGNTKRTFINSAYFQLLQLTVILIVIITGTILTNNKTEKFKLTINYLAHNGRWDELLDLAGKKPSSDRLVQFQTSRALFHTGQLPEKMFNYPQEWGVDGLFLTRYFEDEILLPSSELFFDLSYINEAIHYGNEAMSQNENSPLATEQLILANLAAGKEESAMLYINELKTYPVFYKKALKYERYTKGGPDIEGIGNIINEKARLMPVTDFIVNRKEPQVDLLNILSDHPNNKMAYEYLMALYLLNNDLASFVRYYSLGKQFGYQAIPTLYQQALLLYTYELNRQGKKFAQLNYRKENIEMFTEYLSVLKKYNGNRPDAQKELKQKFGNTYWYYIHYVSPVTTNRKIVVQ
ncbi:MAG: hypothetical protein JW798_00825 [Prolixibacteraceae bacterium]|nr:hypothetical protein [Prolixibacteraceae bacterium]